MKRLILVLLVGSALALVTAAFVRRGCCDAKLAHSADCGDTCCWFRVELGLDGDTIAAIKRAQADFDAECAAHCREVEAAAAALKKLPADAPVADRDAAKATLAVADKTCRDARVAQARRLAALMPEAAGKKYLALVLPRLSGHDHASTPAAAGR